MNWRRRKCLSVSPLHFISLSPFLLSLHSLILPPFPLHFLILSLFPRSLAARLQQVVTACTWPYTCLWNPVQENMCEYVWNPLGSDFSQACFTCWGKDVWGKSLISEGRCSLRGNLRDDWRGATSSRGWSIVTKMMIVMCGQMFKWLGPVSPMYCELNQIRLEAQKLWVKKFDPLTKGRHPQKNVFKRALPR